tara:strand:+ start:3579 stop:3947 length:369 start_codon:yes stop_codon:yes gene_type:complete
MRQKNTRRFDPRYFMDEKTDKPKVLKENRFSSAELSRFAMSPGMEPSVAPPKPWTNPLEQTVDRHDAAILHRMLAEFFAKEGQLPTELELQDLMSKAEKAQDRSRATHGQSESDPHPHFDRR